MTLTHARVAEVVWRLGPDRVLVRQVVDAAGATKELHGAAALTWLALDEPATLAELVDRLTAAGTTATEADVAEALAVLTAEQLVTSAAG